MVRRLYLVIMFVVACTGDQIVSRPPEENVLLWRGDQMHIASAPEIARGESRPVNLPNVHDIADVDAGLNAIGISAVPSDLHGCKLLLGMPASGFREILAFPSAVPAIAISNDGRRIAYSRFAGTADAYDVYVYDTKEQRSPRLLASKLASAGGSLSFREDRNELTFESTDGRIGTVDLRTLQISPLFVGKRPRWSHNGTRLAFRSDEAVYVYDPSQNKSTLAYRRSAADGNFDGCLYWSDSDRFLVFNLNVGVDAPKRRCVVIDMQNASVVLAATTSYVCGPFLPITNK